MNFGYPNTPYATNMSEQYMGNVGTTPNMAYSNQMDYMQQPSCGCGMQSQYMGGYGFGGYNQGGCGQVVQQTCAVDMPYYVNYNTHGNTN